MCGLIGVASAVPAVDREWLIDGLNTFKYRGPDDFGSWWSKNGHVGLGHCRLSILDLTSLGHQPMSSADNSLHIVFNGEIYNFHSLKIELLAAGYQFHTQTDTEVILAAYKHWGFECIDRLNGMFSFAIYDDIRKVVWVARDRIGEKPLYYSFENQVLRFSSELKGLLVNGATSKKISREGLDLYLAIGYIPGNISAIDGVNKLEPGRAIKFNLIDGSLETYEYWRLPEFTLQDSNSVDCSLETLSNELEDLLTQAVCEQLAADVPVGVLLSGGVDSSIITALAASHSAQKIKTFTVAFPGHEKYDESKHATEIANYFGTEHIVLDGGNIGVDTLMTIGKLLDEPMADSSILPTYLLSKMVRKHCKVALGGDGSDELFGGYTHYSKILSIHKKFGFLSHGMKNNIAGLSNLLPTGYKGRDSLKILGSCFVGGEKNLNLSFFNDAERRGLVKNTNDSSGKMFSEVFMGNRFSYSGDLLQRITRYDFGNYLPGDILVKLDRASMMNSLELRSPFLDRRVVEFAFARVGSNFKADMSHRKILLKHLAKRLLPPGFNIQRKQGFSIPLASWLKQGAWRGMAEEILYDHDCIFNKTIIRELFKSIDFGRNNSERIFNLLIFELWRNEFKCSL